MAVAAAFFKKYVHGNWSSFKSRNESDIQETMMEALNNGVSAKKPKAKAKDDTGKPMSSTEYRQVAPLADLQRKSTDKNFELLGQNFAALTTAMENQRESNDKNQQAQLQAFTAALDRLHESNGANIMAIQEIARTPGVARSKSARFAEGHGSSVKTTGKKSRAVTDRKRTGSRSATTTKKNPVRP